MVLPLAFFSYTTTGFSMPVISALLLMVSSRKKERKMYRWEMSMKKF